MISTISIARLPSTVPFELTATYHRSKQIWHRHHSKDQTQPQAQLIHRPRGSRDARTTTPHHGNEHSTEMSIPDQTDDSPRCTRITDPECRKSDYRPATSEKVCLPNSEPVTDDPSRDPSGGRARLKHRDGIRSKIRRQRVCVGQNGCVDERGEKAKVSKDWKGIGFSSGTYLIAPIPVPHRRKAYALSLKGSFTILHGGRTLGGSRARAMNIVGKVRQKFMAAMMRRVLRNAAHQYDPGEWPLQLRSTRLTQLDQ